jgi:hypothetical protein
VLRRLYARTTSSLRRSGGCGLLGRRRGVAPEIPAIDMEAFRAHPLQRAGVRPRAGCAPAGGGLASPGGRLGCDRRPMIAVAARGLSEACREFNMRDAWTLLAQQRRKRQDCQQQADDLEVGHAANAKSFFVKLCAEIRSNFSHRIVTIFE